MKKKELISIQVDLSVKQDLASKAKAEDLSLSQFCRRILKQHIEANPPPAGTEHPGEHAAAA